jgi:hypothetical protein
MGNANYLPGTRYSNQLSFTTTLFADLQHRPFELLHPGSRPAQLPAAQLTPASTLQELATKGKSGPG